MKEAQPPKPDRTALSIAVSDAPGHVLGFTDANGRGVYATRPFLRGETVLQGSSGEVNHSSDPNCELGQTQAGAVELVARLDIEAGSELTLDHAKSGLGEDPGAPSGMDAMARARA